MISGARRYRSRSRRKNTSLALVWRELAPKPRTGRLQGRQQRAHQLAAQLDSHRRAAMSSPHFGPAARAMKMVG